MPLNPRQKRYLFAKKADKEKPRYERKGKPRKKPVNQLSGADLYPKG